MIENNRSGLKGLARWFAAPVFALALFSSAALIFVLQPLFARLVTPLLGGSPAVWNVSMAFFQAALLAGYLYAHLLVRVKDLRLQAGIHSCVLGLAALALPLHVSGLFGAPNYDHPALWLVGVLAVSVGAPFAAASATAPLLQAWYAGSGRADAHDPYYLYAASNLGSLIGLLAYPALIEPALGTKAQGAAWQAGYAVVLVLLLLSAVTALLADGRAEGRPQAPSAAPDWKKKFYWMGAAAVPSALVLGMTLHISTDIASLPLFWVVPLALYLATYIIAFSRGAESLIPTVRAVYPVSLVLLIGSYLMFSDWAAVLVCNIFGFFMSALLCHLALARSRPRADRLTEFYFFVSLGGVLGGAFAAFLAPALFNNVYEYPLALAAAALFLPRGEAGLPRAAVCAAAAAAVMGLAMTLFMWFQAGYSIMLAAAAAALAALAADGWLKKGRPPLKSYPPFVLAAAGAALLLYAALPGSRLKLALLRPGLQDLLVPAVITLALAFVILAAARRARGGSVPARTALALAAADLLAFFFLRVMNAGLDQRALVNISLGLCAAAIFLNRARSSRVAALVLASFLVVFLREGRAGQIITQERSFFGVSRTRVIYDPSDPGRPMLRILSHSNTIHGAQLAAPGFSREPLTYYNPRTALGEAVLVGLSTGPRRRVALIGLGAGSTACLLRPEDRLTIFELDPAVIRLSARPGGDFTYVRDCQPGARIVPGDARLKIAEEPDGAFDVIVVDAFSSDAIPAHLLTREALQLYLRKTSGRGIVILHLSNNSLALVSEAARVARDIGAPAVFRVSAGFEHPRASYYGGMPATAMIVVRSTEALAHLPLSDMPGWRAAEAPEGRGWSDDYVNIARAMWERLNGDEDRLKTVSGGEN